MEVELGSRSQLDCLLLHVPTAGLSDSVFVTLFRTVVGRAKSGVHKLFHSGRVPIALTYIVLGVCRSE